MAHTLFVLLFSVISIGVTPADMIWIFAFWLPVPLTTALVAHYSDRPSRDLPPSWRFATAAAATAIGWLLGLLAGPLLASPEALTLFRTAVVGSSVLTASLTYLTLHAIVRAALKLS